jgi:hypothetical protein
MAIKRHTIKAPKFRLKVYGQFSNGSLGVFESKKEANAFKRRTKKSWVSPNLKKLMKDEQLVVEPLSREEMSRYFPVGTFVSRRGR